MMIATSTHELRTPLHCIKNALEMITVADEGSQKQVKMAIILCEM